jgi:hypothetical protein
LPLLYQEIRVKFLQNLVFILEQFLGRKLAEKKYICLLFSSGMREVGGQRRRVTIRSDVRALYESPEQLAGGGPDRGDQR